MHSIAQDVSDYLQAVPDDRRACLTRLRQLCRDTLAGYEECMAYGMPSYRLDGVVEVAFASQKNYISLYILKEDVVNAHRATLAGLKVGKACITYTRPSKIDFAVVERLLIATRDSSQSAC